MSKRKKKTRPLIVALIVLVILVAIGGLLFFKVVISPDTKNAKDVTFEIADNSYGKQVLDSLEENDVISSSNIIYYYTKLKGIDLNFKSGKYIINTGWDIETLINFLSDASNTVQSTVMVRFLEGSRVKDFAYELSENTTLEYQDIIDYWNNEETIRNLMNDFSFLTEDILDDDVKYYLEGYLFPDTYEFYTNTTIEQATYKILNQTEKIYEEFKDQIEDSKYTVHEIFTLASIIQKETGSPSVMKDVSSVYNNRLDIDMILQSSVTVCYVLDIGINDADKWSQCEIIQDELDPYNTYQYSGFPPGPICSPGQQAIDAALNPNDTDYLFFVADVCGDGTTYFAENYAQQLVNERRCMSCLN